MGGDNAFLEAQPIEELKKKSQEWANEQREFGMEVHHGWNRVEVQETDTGYRIWLHAHS